MTWQDAWEQLERDWREDVETGPTLEELSDELEESVDRVQRRLVEVWGPQILEDIDAD